MKENKTFQTIVGAGVMYLTFVLWRDGWIGSVVDLFNGQEEGFSGPELWLGVVAAILSFTQMVGIATIGIVSGLLPRVEDAVSAATILLKGATEYAKENVPKLLKKGEPASDGQSWNWKPLAAVLVIWWSINSGVLPGIISKVREVISVDQVIDEEEDPVVQLDVSSIIFVTDDDLDSDESSVVYSAMVAAMLESNGIERRRIAASQDVTSSEPWLRNAMSRAPPKRSAMLVVGANGSLIEVRDIPSSVSEMERYIAKIAR